jgi:hypothetical protein
LSYRCTVSVMKRHDDGTSVMARWEVSLAEREKISSLFEGRRAVHGFISPEQYRQASQTARSWQAASGHTGSQPPDDGQPTHSMLCTGGTRYLNGSPQPPESEEGRVIYRQTLSILDWHDDRTLTFTLWDVMSEECEQVELLFRCRPVLCRVTTCSQAREARRATQDWLVIPDSEDI